ncbi:MAG: nucleotidyltransferase [Clostridia bacterium]|nr:nucleotidyltransferase [Clostridia bacterium]
MKTCAIICEYNPFHNGHAYQIAAARELGFEKVVAIMSGNLVQRGETAICDKFSRAKMALMGGADLVVEIPSLFSMAYAEKFANAGVFIANELGCDALVFGSECGYAKKLEAIADNLKSSELDELIKKGLKLGLSYSASRSEAYNQLFGNCPELQNPNDILGIEYISAIKSQNADIEPICIKRKGVEHDASSGVDGFASASYIRELIKNENWNEVEKYLPKHSAFILKDCWNKGKISNIDNIQNAILSKIRTASAAEITKIPGVSDGLEFRLYNAARKASNLDQLLELTKTKRFTLARIKRAILSYYFGLTDDAEKPEYIRVLGFNGKGEELLKGIAGKSNVPIVFRATALKDSKSFQAECKATDLYVLSYNKPGICGTEMTSMIIKV